MNLLRRAAVFMALALPVIDALAIHSVTTLQLPHDGTVTLQLAPALTRHVRKPVDSLLVFNLKYPGGAQGLDDPVTDRSSVRILVRGVGARTRTELAMAQAPSGRAPGPSDRVWLDRSQDGVEIYRIRSASDVLELRVSRAADGALVGTRMARPGASVHTADRRYQEILEIVYQYSSELDASPDQVDRFVTDYLGANLKIVRRQP